MSSQPQGRIFLQYRWLGNGLICSVEPYRQNCCIGFWIVIVIKNRRCAHRV
jgi:hypothetical protein